MAADRTLMAEVRTSLSMIGFGFTIYQTFESLAKSNVLNGGNAPRNFSLLLILLGMGAGYARLLDKQDRQDHENAVDVTTDTG